MIITVIIFCIAIGTAFGMLLFRAWEIRTSRMQIADLSNPSPRFEFRQVEKIMLYLTKHIVQGLVLVLAKYWFIITTKTRQWVEEKWPKVHDYFNKKPESPTIVKPSFISRAILESKAKIRRIKENVKREHAEKQEQE